MSIKVVFFDIGNTLVSGKQWLPGAKEIISEFKASQIRVGLISNTGQLTPEELAERLPAGFSFGEFEEGIKLQSRLSQRECVPPESQIPNRTTQNCSNN